MHKLLNKYIYIFFFFLKEKQTYKSFVSACQKKTLIHTKTKHTKQDGVDLRGLTEQTDKLILKQMTLEM